MLRLEWFHRYYAGRSHIAATVVYVVTLDGRRVERLTETTVTFRADVARWLNRYLLTGEPRGYGLQGAVSVFVEKIERNLSNVISLLLEALLDLFAEAELK